MPVMEETGLTSPQERLTERVQMHRQQLIEALESEASHLAEGENEAMHISVLPGPSELIIDKVEYVLLFCQTCATSRWCQVDGTSISLRATIDATLPKSVFGTHRYWRIPSEAKESEAKRLVELDVTPIDALQRSTGLPAFYLLLPKETFLKQVEPAATASRARTAFNAAAMDVLQQKKGAVALASFLLEGPSFVAQETSVHLLQLMQTALAAVRIALPYFVPTGSLKRHLYFGQGNTASCETKYKTLAPAFTPSGCQTLRGMLLAFQERVKGYGDMLVEGHLAYMEAEPIADALWHAALEKHHLAQHIGPWFSPIEHLHLHALFPPISAEELPLDAPRPLSDCPTWQCGVDPVESSQSPGFVAGCRLAEYLKTAFLSWQAHALHVLSHESEKAEEPTQVEYMMGATAGVMELFGGGQTQRQTYRHAAKLVQDSLKRGVLQALNVDGTSHLYPDHEPGLSSSALMSLDEDVQTVMDTIFLKGHLDCSDQPTLTTAMAAAQRKAAGLRPPEEIMSKLYETGLPIDSLAFRFVEACHTFLQSREMDKRPPFGRFLHLVWQAILAQCRAKWSQRALLPFLSIQVDLRYSLVAQKLALLGYCARHRLPTPAKHDDTLTSKFTERQEDGWTTFDLDDGEEEDSSSDEFYDSVEDPSGMLATMEAMNLRNAHALAKIKPQGVLHVLPGEYLLHSPALPIHVPVTQLPGPMTRDQLVAQEHVLQSFGEDDAGRAARMALQSVGLQSDMSAFKAANPEAVLEDFVRWHSPRDWVKDDLSGDYTLSGRMSGENNLWRQTWLSAEAMPVEAQTPLFDCDKEGEAALQWLEALSPFTLLSSCLPSVLVASYMSLCDYARVHRLLDHPSVVQRLNAFTEEVIVFGWHELEGPPVEMETVLSPAMLLVEKARRLEGDLAMAHAFHHFILPSVPVASLPLDTLWQHRTLYLVELKGEEARLARAAMGRYFSHSTPHAQEYYISTKRARPPNKQSRPSWHHFHTTLTDHNKAFRATIALSSDRSE